MRALQAAQWAEAALLEVRCSVWKTQHRCLLKTLQKHQSAGAGSRRFTTPGKALFHGLQEPSVRRDEIFARRHALPSQHCVAFVKMQQIKSGEREFGFATNDRNLSGWKQRGDPSLSRQVTEPEPSRCTDHIQGNGVSGTTA